MLEANSNKTCYLSLIQEPILRMSTASAVFKGFGASAVAGLIMKNDISLCNVVLTLVLVISFLCVDIYYLRIERKFRYLYNQVVKDEHPVDFDMTTIFSKEEIKDANATIGKCLVSHCIALFYIPLVGILVFLGIIA